MSQDQPFVAMENLLKQRSFDEIVGLWETGNISDLFQIGFARNPTENSCCVTFKLTNNLMLIFLQYLFKTTYSKNQESMSSDDLKEMQKFISWITVLLQNVNKSDSDFDVKEFTITLQTIEKVLQTVSPYESRLENLKESVGYLKLLRVMMTINHVDVS